MKSQIYRNVTCNQCNEVMEYDVFEAKAIDHTVKLMKALIKSI